MQNRKLKNRTEDGNATLKTEYAEPKVKHRAEDRNAKLKTETQNRR